MVLGLRSFRIRPSSERPDGQRGLNNDGGIATGLFLTKLSESSDTVVRPETGLKPQRYLLSRCRSWLVPRETAASLVGCLRGGTAVSLTPPLAHVT